MHGGINEKLCYDFIFFFLSMNKLLLALSTWSAKFPGIHVSWKPETSWVSQNQVRSHQIDETRCRAVVKRVSAGLPVQVWCAQCTTTAGSSGAVTIESRVQAVICPKEPSGFMVMLWVVDASDSLVAYCVCLSCLQLLSAGGGNGASWPRGESFQAPFQRYLKDHLQCDVT